MALSLHIFNHPQVFSGSLNTKRTSNGRRQNLSVAAQISSVFEQIDDSQSSSQSKMIKPTVGIIGGVSVLSTLIFLEKLVWMSSRDGKGSIPFVVCSDPSITRVLPSRNSATKESNVVDPIENLKCKRQFLENSGARCIVMPCHISHAWYREISDGCLLPFFHVGECVADELKQAKLKPLEMGHNVRIGMLTSHASLTAGYYQEQLQNQGFEVVLPDKETADHILMPAIDALARRDMEGAQNLLRIAIQILLMRSVNIVILASDELQDVLPRNDPLRRKCLDPMDALARSIVKWVEHKNRVHCNT